MLIFMHESEVLFKNFFQKKEKKKKIKIVYIGKKICKI